MGITEKLLEELERNPEAARRLGSVFAEAAADAVIEELLRNRELRRRVLLAVSSEAVTRSDLERLVTREEFRDAAARLEKRLDIIERRIDRLEERMDTFMRWMIGLLVTIWATLLAAVLVMLRVVLAGG